MHVESWGGGGGGGGGGGISEHSMQVQSKSLALSHVRLNGDQSRLIGGGASESEPYQSIAMSPAQG